jgi:hypothetical protein
MAGIRTTVQASDLGSMERLAGCWAHPAWFGFALKDLALPEFEALIFCTVPSTVISYAPFLPSVPLLQLFFSPLSFNYLRWLVILSCLARSLPTLWLPQMVRALFSFLEACNATLIPCHPLKSRLNPDQAGNGAPPGCSDRIPYHQVTMSMISQQELRNIGSLRFSRS